MNDPPIQWNEFFMGVADLASRRSKDPNTQVGACIVDERKRIVATGYNGFVTCEENDNKFPWAREGPPLETKYPYVVHSEANAILNAVTDLRGSTLFVTKHPCNECSKLIAQAGIRTVLYRGEIVPDDESTQAAQRIFEACDIDVYEF